MQNLDRFELPITSADCAGAKTYDRYVGEFLSYGPELRCLFEAADENPGAPLLNAHAAALHMAFEAADGWTAAAPYLARMKETQESGTEREKLFCAAVAAWHDKNFAGSLEALDELTVRWPADLCAIKWGQYHAFNLGDAEALLRFGERARIAHENTPYAHGMTAFALEQNHRLDEAEDEGMRASEIAIDDAWAHHAVAHVMETQSRAREGVRWLDHCAHTWEHKGVFIRDHNHWHAALFRLSLGQENEALAIYDKYLWGAWTEFPQEQIGAVSMLWRLELRGIDAGDRWTPVVREARERAGDHLFAFHDLHYLYALARAGEPHEADDFLATLHRKAEEDATGVWSDVCFPVAEGLVAHLRGDPETALEKISPALTGLHRIGGSHAQRHVFVETLEACMKKPRREAGAFDA
ncbi:tetratricopeptide repeat protein [Hyphococcus sp.]|uniref:tetratricopeptide repeat protein n=1 Tax=Hyphococcus sp. TaxID=2038636 RepID=UPI0035C668AF